MPVVQHVDISTNGDLQLFDDESITLQVPNVIQNSPFCDVLTPGILVITNRRVAWINNDVSTKGSCYNFRDISMHAVASESYDKPCLYCHLDTEDVTEIRFTPEDSSTIQNIYDAFCKGALDNPDFDEEEPMDAWISSALEDEDEEGQFDDPITL